MAENTAALAEAIDIKEVPDLTEKTSPVDTDLFTVGNAGTAALKKMKWINILSAIQTKFKSWTFTLNTTDKTIPGALNELRESTESLNVRMEDAMERQNAQDAAIKKRIIVGSTDDCMIIVTNQTLSFAEGVATFNAKSIGTAYSKTISNVLAQIKVAGGTVITSATVSSDGVVSVRAYNIGAKAAYVGDLVCTIILFLS